ARPALPPPRRRPGPRPRPGPAPGRPHRRLPLPLARPGVERRRDKAVLAGFRRRSLGTARSTPIRPSTALSRVSAKVAAAWPPPDRGGCHAEHHDGSSVGRGVRPLARAVPGAAGAGRAATLGAHLSGGASLAG